MTQLETPAGDERHDLSGLSFADFLIEYLRETEMKDSLRTEARRRLAEDPARFVAEANAFDEYDKERLRRRLVEDLANPD